MAEKEPVIVIKKITVQAAGAHGGSWKVAFADFMTALMAFFLVMWLIGQSEEVKSNVAEYFSTPSVIEYYFSNYGVELTLEKMFLDLVNEPLKFFQAFIRPMDHKPDFMAMGSKRIVMQHLANELGDKATEVQIHSDEMSFEIPDHYLFHRGTAMVTGDFVDLMQKVQGILAGLNDSIIFVDSRILLSSVDGDSRRAQNVADERMDLVTQKIRSSLEHDTVDIFGRPVVEGRDRDAEGRPTQGSIRIRVKQKEQRADGSRPRQMRQMFGRPAEGLNAYENFVRQLTQ